MFSIKYFIAKNLIKENKIENANRLLLNISRNYPENPEPYIELAKIAFKRNLIKETKKYLTKLTTIKNWYKENIVRDVLEITNWKMLVEPKFFCKEPKFSYDGQRIVFLLASKDTNEDGKINNSDCASICIIDRDAKNQKTLVEDSYYNSSAKFSNDGRFIVFLSARRDTNADGIIDNKDDAGLYIMNIETGEERLIIEDYYKPKHPCFSPDGKKILFTCWRSPNSYSGVYEIILDTLEVNEIVSENYENTFPSYSTEGDKIIFSSWRGNRAEYGFTLGRSAIYIKNLNTFNEYCISSDKYINSFPVFSNNSDKVAYLSKRRDTDGNGEIDALDNDGLYLYDLNKEKEIVIHSDKYYNKFINFTKDDKYIVFLSNHKTSFSKKVLKDYFEPKGVCKCDVLGKSFEQFVSNTFFGSNSPCVSKKNDEVVYTSFYKNTLRGLYLAYINQIPNSDEVIEIIKNNLRI